MPNAIKGRDNIEIEIYGMEGIPEEDLRAHEKRLAGKDKDEPDTADAPKAPPPPVMNMPPMPPLGMMPGAPMMPMGFPGMPFGMPLPMMPMSMMAQMRQPVPMIPPTANNTTAAPPRPLFPSGAHEVRLFRQCNSFVLMLIEHVDE